MPPHLRVARPVRNLQRSVAMYQAGLSVEVLGSFNDHVGFDGVMLGHPGGGYHFEFTHCRHHPVEPQPTVEDLLVFYAPDAAEWQERCEKMLAAGFRSVVAFNPYWGERGRTFEDPDGYRVVIERSAWGQRP